MIFMLKLISLTNTHSGHSFRSLKTTFRIGHSTIKLTVKNTCKALCSSLVVDYLKLQRSGKLFQLNLKVGGK